jgi:hypothetical protein
LDQKGVFRFAMHHAADASRLGDSEKTEHCALPQSTSRCARRDHNGIASDDRVSALRRMKSLSACIGILMSASLPLEWIADALPWEAEAVSRDSRRAGRISVSAA